MKLILLSLLFCSCASTSVYENGKPVLKTQMNARRVVYRSPAGSYLEVEEMDHSTPTRAGGSVIGTAGSAAIGIIAAGGGGVGL